MRKPQQARIYRDSLVRVSVVVQDASGQLWVCPCVPGGWSRRLAAKLTPEARKERLRPARDVCPQWLGVEPAATT